LLVSLASLDGSVLRLVDLVLVMHGIPDVRWPHNPTPIIKSDGIDVHVQLRAKIISLASQFDSGII